MSHRCRWGRGCGEAGGAGVFGNFCEKHAAVLAEIAEEMADAKGEKYRIYGTRPGYEANDQEAA